jgi:hypothetical protein
MPEEYSGDSCIYPSILGDKHLSRQAAAFSLTCIYPSILGDKHPLCQRNILGIPVFTPQF